MARPREFDEITVLEAAMRCFWSRGYEATSVRDLADVTGLTAASLYNAFGDKRALYRKTLERYIDTGIAARIGHCRTMPPREAISAFFADILERSLHDRRRKGCMMVNAALEVAPHDAGFRRVVAKTLSRIEAFFLERIKTGQIDGTISRSMPPDLLAKHLLGVLMGVRVLARVKPDRALLEGAIAPALALLEPSPRKN